MNAAQCRAARALLGINQDELAALSGVSAGTIKDFERGARQLLKRTQADLQRALETQGITFLDTEEGEGVLRRRGEGG